LNLTAATAGGATHRPAVRRPDPSALLAGTPTRIPRSNRVGPSGQLSTLGLHGVGVKVPFPLARRIRAAQDGGITSMEFPVMSRALRPSAPGSSLGFAWPLWRCTFNATSPLCSLGAGSSSVLDARRRPGVRVAQTPQSARSRQDLGSGTILHCFQPWKRSRELEAVAAVLAWLAAHPPVSAAAGSAATGAIGKPSGEKQRCQPGCGLFGSPSSLR
jgi:hypothetical protein